MMVAIYRNAYRIIFDVRRPKRYSEYAVLVWLSKRSPSVE